MLMNRSLAAELGRQTLQILAAGRYTAPSGAAIDIADPLRKAVEGTVSYPPDRPAPAVAPGDRSTHFEVNNETTLAAARRLVEAGRRPAALNFASANNPGGGFLTGARAQEESLVRSSDLYVCLSGNPMYDFHRRQRDPLYSDYVLHSPDVPVFRTDEGDLLEKPYLCSFATSPAVNAGAVLQRDPTRRPAVRDAMRSRVAKVLAVAAAHGHDTLVLGAWGCGVFGNDPAEVAELFREALAGPFRGLFAHVVFAIVDWSDDRYFLGPFRRSFVAG
jgi:uncharacterized protein (TIGR02452 family)